MLEVIIHGPIGHHNLMSWSVSFWQKQEKTIMSRILKSTYLFYLVFAKLIPIKSLSSMFWHEES